VTKAFAAQDQLIPPPLHTDQPTPAGPVQRAHLPATMPYFLATLGPVQALASKASAVPAEAQTSAAGPSAHDR
jgi:hypothetical protein